MKILLRFVVVMVFLIGLTSVATGQQRERCGLMHILEKESRSRDLDNWRPPAPESKPSSPKPVVGPSGRLELLHRRIAELKEKSRLTTKPVDSLSQARDQLAELRRRREILTRKYDQQIQEALDEVARKTGEFRKKWGQISKEITRGAGKSWRDWIPTVDRAVQALENKNILDYMPTKAVNDRIAMPAVDQESQADEANRGRPKPATGISVPNLSDLRDAFADNKKPPGMSVPQWVTMQDRFMHDLAQLQANIAAAKKQLEKRRARQFASIDRAIAAAEDMVDKYSGKGRPSLEDRRDIAWRIHIARVRELEELYRRLADAERASGSLGEGHLIKAYPLAPEKTLNQLARLLDTEGRPPVPTTEELESQTADGLPPLYPTLPQVDPESRVDPGLQFERLLRARIAQTQRELDKIHRKLANAEEVVKRGDVNEVRRLQTVLYSIDLERGDADHPIRQAKRRVAAKEKWAELSKTRAARVEKLKRDLREALRSTREYLEKDYRRLETFEARAEPD